MIIFVDTSAFLARHARRDPYNQVAARIWRDLDRSALITTNHVVEETLSLLARRIGYGLAAEVAEILYGSAHLEIMCTSRDEEIEAVSAFRKYADQQVSFTDCISFAVMRRNAIPTAFTFDRHFLHAGFRVIGLQ